jgi:hypothetical protein
VVLSARIRPRVWRCRLALMTFPWVLAELSDLRDQLARSEASRHHTEVRHGYDVPTPWPDDHRNDKCF